MTLSDEQEERMYDDTLKTRQDLEWVRERLGKGDESMKCHAKRLRRLEVEHSLMKGKLGSFIAGLTLVATLIVNGFIWILGHFWSK